MDTVEPVWITGVGAATPLGCKLAEIEANLLAGRSGVSLVTRFPTDDYPSRIAAQLNRPLHSPDGDASVVRRSTSRSTSSRTGASSRPCATQISGRRIARAASAWFSESARSGCCTGRPTVKRGACGFTTPTKTMIRPSSGFIESSGSSGPALALSAACASGNHALEIGRQWLRLGLVDVCVAGACDLAVTPIGLATFGNLRALSRRNADPAAASRPFDRGRDGFVLGEGGVAFVLERAAAAHGAVPHAYAEVAGCGSSSDAHHHVIPSPDPAPAAAAVRRALADARIEPGEVDHVNAHATSTPVGDTAEAAVLRLVLGDDADRIPVTSTKSLTGHMLTAAGAFEALACLTAMRHQAIPPTINLDEPDVDLCLVANEARPHKVKIAVSNSFGFGGSNTSLVLRAV